MPELIMDGWLEPALSSAAIRRDAQAYLRSTRRHDYRRAARRMSDFRGPALVLWAAEDRVMPPAHGRRLAELLPDARLVTVADSYTLIPEDRPDACAEAIRTFVRETSVRP
jgi:pimeloyl-ACP methyl ester carboxylesterase